MCFKRSLVVMLWRAGLSLGASAATANGACGRPRKMMKRTKTRQSPVEGLQFGVIIMLLTQLTVNVVAGEGEFWSQFMVSCCDRQFESHPTVSRALTAASSPRKNVRKSTNRRARARL